MLARLAWGLFVRFCSSRTLSPPAATQQLWPATRPCMDARSCKEFWGLAEAYSSGCLNGQNKLTETCSQYHRVESSTAASSWPMCALHRGVRVVSQASCSRPIRQLLRYVSGMAHDEGRQQVDRANTNETNEIPIQKRSQGLETAVPRFACFLYPGQFGRGSMKFAESSSTETASNSHAA